MARRHIVQYFLEVENQYFEMQALVKEAKELLIQGQFTEEAFLQLEASTQKLKENYERIAYIMFLYNKPNKKEKKEVKLAQSWYERLKFSSKETIMNENKDVLSHIKQLIKENKL